MPALLHAAPNATVLPAELRDALGSLLSSVVESRTHREYGETVELRRCFEYPVAPSNAFLLWCIRHGERLTWPTGARYSAETTRWRRALLYDEPPGRDVAQEAAMQELGRLGAQRSARKW